jgi:hypothetical protein
MDHVRAYACEGLLRLSQGGRDVGGVLFGTRLPEGIRILAWRPITCEYSDGDTLRLSYRDRMNLAVEFEAARTNPELKGFRPVGWFVSHPRGEVAMTAEDLETFSNFFPESWQVTLVMHPIEGGRAQAGFFARETDGNVRSEASYKNFVLEPVHARPEVSETVPESTPVPAPVRVSPAAAVRTSEPEPATLEAPVFRTDPPLPTRDRWLWAIPILLALGIAGWLLYQRQMPAHPPRLAFRISASNGRTAQLEWDPNSSAIRASSRGQLDITDGGKTLQVQLTSDQLHAGRTTYIAQSGDASFEFIVYPANGDPVHESTRLIAPVDPTAEPPPPAPSPTPSPVSTAAPAATDQDGLQGQMRQLREDLAKERARADQAENLVRILENRLGIQADKRPTKP